MVRSGIPSISTVRELLGMSPLTAASDYDEALWVRDKNGQWVTYVGLSLEEMWVTDPATGQEVPQFSYGDIYSSNIDTTPDYKARVASPTLPDGTVVFEVGSSVNDLGKTEPPPEDQYDQLPTELPTDLEPGETVYVRVNPDTFELDTAEEEARASLDTEPVEEEQPPPPPAEARLIPQREAAEVLRAAGVNAAEATQIARDNGVWTRDGKTFAAVPTPRNLQGDRLAAAEHTLKQLEEETRWLVEDVKTTREAGGTPTAEDEEFLVAMEEATENQRQEVAKVRDALAEAAGPEGINRAQVWMAVEALGYLEEAVAGLPTHMRERDGQQRPFRVMLDERLTGPRGAAGITQLGSDSMGISPREFNKGITRNAMRGTRWKSGGEYAIHHELGHMVDGEAGKEGSSFSSFQVWDAAIKTGEMSEYGKTNMQEGYAEAFARWQSDPDHPVAQIYAEAFGWEEEDLDAEQPPSPPSAAVPPALTTEQVDVIDAATSQRTPPPGWTGEPIGDGVSEPYLWTAPDGSRMIAKTGWSPNSPDQVHVEQIAVTALHQIGFPHTPAAHANPDGTVAGITFATDGTPLTDPSTAPEYNREKLNEWVENLITDMENPDDLVALLAYDIAMNNADRHTGNLFVARHPDGTAHMLPIDHGASLVRPIQMWDIEDLVDDSIHSPTMRQYVAQLRQQNPGITSKEVEDRIRSIVAATFDKLGRVQFTPDDRAKGSHLIERLETNLATLNTPDGLDAITSVIVENVQSYGQESLAWWRGEEEERPPPPAVDAGSIRDRIRAARAQAQQPEPEVVEQGPPTLTQEQIDAINNAETQFDAPEGWESNYLGGGASQPQIWTAPDGSRLVAKTGVTPNSPAQVWAEQIASTILQQAGFPYSPTAIANTDGTVVGITYAADGTPLIDPKGFSYFTAAEGVKDVVNRLTDPEDVMRFFVFDLVTGNRDRHAGNLMTANSPDGSGHLLPIDHGMALVYSNNHPLNVETLLYAEMHQHTVPSYLDRLRRENPDMDPWDMEAHLRASIKDSFAAISTVEFSDSDKVIGQSHINQLARNLEYWNNPEMLDHTVGRILNSYQMTLIDRRDEWFDQPRRVAEEQPPSPTETAASPTLNPEQAAAIDAATDHRTPPPGWTAEPIGDGVSEPYLWTAPDGTRMVAKTGPVPGRVHMVHAEQIAPVILQQIGFPHAPAGYSNPDGTVAGLSFATDGTPLTDARTIRGTGLIGYEQIITDALPKMNDPADFVRLLAFDLAAYNTDRHSANLFLADDPDGKLHILPIDHGEALNPWQTVPPDMIFDILLSTSVHSATLPLYVKKLRADNPDMGPREISDHLRGIIQNTLDDIGNVTFSADDKEKGGEAINKLASTLEVVNSPEFMDEAMKSVVSLFTTNQPYTEYQWWHPPAPQSEEQPPPPTDAAAVRDRIRAAREKAAEPRMLEGAEAEAALRTSGLGRKAAKHWAERGALFTTDGQTFSIVTTPKARQQPYLQEQELRLRAAEQNLQTAQENGVTGRALTRVQGYVEVLQDEVDQIRRYLETAGGAEAIDEHELEQGRAAAKMLSTAVGKLPAWRRSDPRTGKKETFLAVMDPTLPTGVGGEAMAGANHMSINPRSFDKPLADQNPGHLMSSDGYELMGEYGINHELGHLLDARRDASQYHPDVWNEAIATGLLSTYGQSDIREGYAEAFAMWTINPNHPVAKLYADHFGWNEETYVPEDMGESLTADELAALEQLIDAAFASDSEEAQQIADTIETAIDIGYYEIAQMRGARLKEILDSQAE